jgi:thiamine biosynthesis lipoprotein
MQYDEFRAMNTAIQVAAEGSRAALEPAFRGVREFIAECEARFSRFLPDSELCQLNRSSGRWFAASPELFDILDQAMELYRLTGGLFDPTILSALERAGYDRSIDIIRAAGARSIGSPAGAQSVPGLDRLRLDPDRLAVFLPERVQIDLGGIAKGWIAGRAVSLLSNYTSAGAVGAGGDIAFFGTPAGEQFWEVSLEDPRDPQQVLAVLTLQSGALATSSVTRRRWLQAGREKHHIIDPRTGVPAEEAWLSVSVSAGDAAVAEAFAKAILIAGPGAADRLVEQIPGLWFVSVSPDGSLSGTQQGMELVYELI